MAGRISRGCHVGTYLCASPDDPSMMQSTGRAGVEGQASKQAKTGTRGCARSRKVCWSFFRHPHPCLVWFGELPVTERDMLQRASSGGRSRKCLHCRMKVTFSFYFVVGGCSTLHCSSRPCFVFLLPLGRSRLSISRQAARALLLFHSLPARQSLYGALRVEAARKRGPPSGRARGLVPAAVL